MKNKILTKIITCVVSVSVLVSVFAISSSAYTWGNTSAYHNSVEQFTLPTTMIVLENINSRVTDVPGYFYVPTSDYYGRGERVLSSVNSVIDDNDVNFAVLNSVTSSNVYENNGFVQGGDIKFKTFSNDVDFNTIFDLAGIRVEDYWFDSDLNSSPESSIYFSTTVSLPNADWREQLNPDNFETIWSVPVQYRFKYYDYDGVYHETTFINKLFPDDEGNVMITYFPDIIYPNWILNTQEQHPLQPEYIHIYDDMAYLDVLDISIMRDLCVPNFLVSSTETNIDCKGSYISRLLYPNYIGDSFDTVIDNASDTYYDNGYDLGYDTGYDGGYSAGTVDGYYDGYDAGNSAGYNTGYDDGYVAGIAQGGSGTLNPFDSIISAVGTFLDWEFIDGISMAGLLSVVLGVCLVLTFLKIFAGG